MPELLTEQYDFSAFWTFGLLIARFAGVIMLLPGIGTKNVPMQVQGGIAIMLSAAVTMAGVRAPYPDTLVDGGLMVIAEYLLGTVLAIIPVFILSALGVAGQVVSGAIGLGMANMIDPSLGQNSSVLSTVQTMIGTIVFLMIDGHHIIIRAAAGVGTTLAVGTFKPDGEVAWMLLERFQALLELAVTVSAPILVTVMITQFVMGLITRFIPQVNIFIISLPLTIGLGLFITVYTFPGMVNKVIGEFSLVEEIVYELLTKAGP